MSEQKFQRGNLVKVLVGHQIWSTKGGETTTQDISPEDVGQEAIIQYSYADEYGGNNRKDYSIMFMESGNTIAWKSEKELEFIDEGGEHLFEQAKKNGEELLKANKEKGIYSSADWCRLIAWMINCDNKYIKFTDKVYTADLILHSNSHGELSGIMATVDFVSTIFEHKMILAAPFRERCTKILKGEEIEPESHHASGVGMRCITFLYKTTPEFDAAIGKYFNSKQ